MSKSVNLTNFIVDLSKHYIELDSQAIMLSNDKSTSDRINMYSHDVYSLAYYALYNMHPICERRPELVEKYPHECSFIQELMEDNTLQEFIKSVIVINLHLDKYKLLKDLTSIIRDKFLKSGMQVRIELVDLTFKLNYAEYKSIINHIHNTFINSLFSKVDDNGQLTNNNIPTSKSLLPFVLMVPKLNYLLNGLAPIYLENIGRAINYYKTCKDVYESMYNSFLDFSTSMLATTLFDNKEENKEIIDMALSTKCDKQFSAVVYITAKLMTAIGQNMENDSKWKTMANILFASILVWDYKSVLVEINNTIFKQSNEKFNNVIDLSGISLISDYLNNFREYLIQKILNNNYNFNFKYFTGDDN